MPKISQQIVTRFNRLVRQDSEPKDKARVAQPKKQALTFSDAPARPSGPEASPTGAGRRQNAGLVISKNSQMAASQRPSSEDRRPGTGSEARTSNARPARTPAAPAQTDPGKMPPKKSKAEKLADLDNELEAYLGQLETKQYRYGPGAGKTTSILEDAAATVRKERGNTAKPMTPEEELDAVIEVAQRRLGEKSI